MSPSLSGEKMFVSMKFLKFGSALLVQFATVVALATPLVIGHRGASGYRPEHTLEAYQLAIDQGADFIEPDLVMTKDGVLVVRHENEISTTTDVAKKFPDRVVEKTIDGFKVRGWFTEDFTLAEIKTLRAEERLAKRNQSYNGKFVIPTFEEVIQLARKKDVGIYPEMKHPTYFRKLGLSLEPEVIRLLKKYNLHSSTSKVFVQCFEFSPLVTIRKSISAKTIFLLSEPQGHPYDTVDNGKPKTYRSYVDSPKALAELAKAVSGIGPSKRYIVPVGKDGSLQKPTPLVAAAHAAGLQVHPYTFRSDKDFLPKEYGDDPIKEYIQFFEQGVDGVFSDFPDHAVKARDRFLKDKVKK